MIHGRCRVVNGLAVVYNGVPPWRPGCPRLRRGLTPSQQAASGGSRAVERGKDTAVDLRVKRVYDPPDPSDGARMLVDRLWPRGLKRSQAHLYAWVREVAPSDDLRRWFGHDPARWEEFLRRYFRELDAHPQGWQPLLEAANQGPLTLLYAAHDPDHNNAVALKVYLEARPAQG